MLHRGLRGYNALANPIAIDAERRSIAMRSERVDVVVGAGKSRVNGVFRFQQEPPITNKQRHITIFVPILLPDTLTTRRYDGLFGSPRVEVSGRGFSAVAWNDIQLEGSPESVPLPRGWSMRLYVCNVPLRILDGSFDAKVSYVQPHFSNDIAAYIPIRPPQDETVCLVVFSAEPGRKLRQVSGVSFLSSKKDTLQFAPRDRKLIRVQSLKGAASSPQRS
jgi:hypothetical protein